MGRTQFNMQRGGENISSQVEKKGWLGKLIIKRLHLVLHTILSTFNVIQKINKNGVSKGMVV